MCFKRNDCYYLKWWILYTIKNLTYIKVKMFSYNLDIYKKKILLSFFYYIQASNNNKKEKKKKWIKKITYLNKVEKQKVLSP